MTNKLIFCFIVPTRNRPKDIRALLKNLAGQSAKPDQVIIIDSSDIPQPELKKEFPSLDINYHVFDGSPSAAAQRNAGLDHIRGSVDLIGFVDDDMIFEEGALLNMLEFWQGTTKGVCGAAFNLLEEDISKGRTGSTLWRMTQWLGLYRLGVGQVAPSGWHSRVRQVEQNASAEWLITGAAVWLPEVFKEHQLDEFYEGYSYLEDLDFSYGLSRHCELVIVANARVHHFHHHRAATAQWSDSFGRMEVRNRLHFVRKYNLSIWRCYLALTIRLAMTLAESLKTGKTVLLSRAKGNLVGLWEVLFQRRT